MSWEFKPCPFCRAQPIRYVDLTSKPTMHTYKCENEFCQVQPETREFVSPLKALNAWNEQKV